MCFCLFRQTFFIFSTHTISHYVPFFVFSLSRLSMASSIGSRSTRMNWNVKPKTLKLKSPRLSVLNPPPPALLPNLCTTRSSCRTCLLSVFYPEERLLTTYHATLKHKQIFSRAKSKHAKCGAQSPKSQNKKYKANAKYEQVHHDSEGMTGTTGTCTGRCETGETRGDERTGQGTIHFLFGKSQMDHVWRHEVHVDGMLSMAWYEPNQ